MLLKKSEILTLKSLNLTALLEREAIQDLWLADFIFSHSVRLYFNQMCFFLFFFFATL